MKARYLLPLFSVFSILAGCEDTESEEVCRYYVQQELDSADYQSAIQRLDDISCQETYPENEFYVDLGTAYLGKAGFTLPEVISEMIKNRDNAQANQFAAFIEESANSASETSIIDLVNSRKAFVNYLEGQECEDIIAPNATQNDICLLIGFVDIVKTAMAIESMAGNNINGWLNNAEGNTPAMLRSTCALKYSYDHKYDSEFSLPYRKCKEGVSVDDSEFVTFTASDNTAKDYNSLTVSYQEENGYFLESEEAGSTVFTNGYCQIDYSLCNAPSLSGCYACPVNHEADELAIKEFVLDSLNNGFDNIEATTVNTESDNELKQALDDFKTEIKTDGCEQIADGEDCFTMDDVINYLNKD